jgi:deoxyribodipyrimidine photolyase-related protein
MNLYWAFLIRNQAQLRANPRIAMLYRALAKWSAERKQSWLDEAATFLEQFLLEQFLD